MSFKQFNEQVQDVGKTLWLDLGVIKVFSVDGKKVREIDMEFTEGGHHFRYNFIPFGEIWIERMLNMKEEPFTLIHEMTEFINMAYKKDYETSHKYANVIESFYRKSFLNAVPTPPPPPPPPPCL